MNVEGYSVLKFNADGLASTTGAREIVVWQYAPEEKGGNVLLGSIGVTMSPKHSEYANAERANDGNAVNCHA